MAAATVPIEAGGNQVLHSGKLVRRAVMLGVAATLALLVGAGQSAQAAPSQRQTEHAAVMGVPVGTSTAATGHFYTGTWAADGSIVISEVGGPADDPVVYASWSLKLSHSATVGIFNGALAGATAVVIAICQTAAPSPADFICSAGGTILAAIVRSLGEPGPNDCLGITLRTRLAIPPWAIDAGYVNCN